MIPGDFQYRKPSRKKIILVAVTGIGGLAGLVVTALIITYVISAWIGRPVIFGYDDGPQQPIAFPHTTHVEQLGLDCTFCHRTVAEEPVATIPAVGLCMTCHLVVGDGNPEVEKLRDYFASGESIDWVRVHRVPDHVVGETAADDPHRDQPIRQIGVGPGNPGHLTGIRLRPQDSSGNAHEQHDRPHPLDHSASLGHRHRLPPWLQASADIPDGNLVGAVI